MPPHDWDHAPTAAEARRWQLLSAGRKAILEHGLDAFTVDDVVGFAGLAKGSFYTYFASREVFLDALRMALAEDVGEAAHEAAAGPWAGLFERMMRAARDWLIENERLRGIASGAYMANPERPTREPLLAIVSDVLRAGVEAGVLGVPEASPGVDPIGEAAPMALDVMREASGRAALSYPDETPITTASAFLERALGLDARAAQSTVYAPAAA